MQESEPLIYNSEFLPSVQIAVVFEENPQYEDLRQFFQDYGYGFMVPGKNLVIIDGEQLAQLMIDYNLGCTTQQIYELKKIDSDYFGEE